MEALPVCRVLTDDELIAVPKVGGKHELEDGDLILGPTGFRHDRLVTRLLTALERCVEECGAGVVQGPDLGYRMGPLDVRCPDVSFIRAERARYYVETDADTFFEGAPDLAVEILSPSDSSSRTKEKARLYFSYGCRLCWIVDPQRKMVLVMTPDGSERTLTVNDELDGGEALPEFKLAVCDIFRKPALK
jgi:Uma2 family endonuclease